MGGPRFPFDGSLNNQTGPGLGPPTQCPTYLRRRCFRASGAYIQSGNTFGFHVAPSYRYSHVPAHDSSHAAVCTFWQAVARTGSIKVIPVFLS